MLRADHSSGVVLPSVVCLSVIAEPQNEKAKALYSRGALEIEIILGT